MIRTQIQLSENQVRSIKQLAATLGVSMAEIIRRAIDDKIKEEFNCIRVDIDNRDETVGKKIRDAEKEWVPYIIVVGEKEVDIEKYNVRVRGKKKPVEYSVCELEDAIHNITAGKPYRPVPVPIYLEDRPKFVG